MTIHRHFHPNMMSLDANPFVSQKEFSVDSSSFLTYCLSWYGMFCLKFSNCLQQPFPVGWFANLNHGNAIQRLVKWVEMDFERAFLNITRVRLQWLASRAIWDYRVLCYLSTLGDFRNISTISVFLLAIALCNFNNFDTKMV